MYFPAFSAARFKNLALLFLVPFLSLVSTRAEKVYFVGNSVTDTINYAGLVTLAESRGYTHPWGRQMIPGAPLQWIWDHPDGGFTQAPYNYPSQALPNYAWNVISLQPFDRSLASDLDYSQRFIGQLYGSTSPTSSQTANRGNSRIFVYGRWPRQDAPDAPVIRSFDQLWQRPHPGGGFNDNETAEYFSELTEALRGVSVSGVPLASRTFMVPVGHVMYELNQQMKAGQIPGYHNIFQIYADGIHLNNVGSYLATCTYFTTIYRESPVGLPVPAQFGLIDAALATAIQQTIWNVVRTQPLSGVPGVGNLTIGTLSIPGGYRDQPYSISVLAIGGIAPRTFSVTSGALPPGIVLSTSGMLAGTPVADGDFDFEITATDSTTPLALTASQSYRLRVETNRVPVISTPPQLVDGARGSRYTAPLAASGGNGALTWTLVSGVLPTGLVLGGGGVLSGTPVQQGSFNFTARASDSDSADTASRNFSLVIAPPLPGTLLIAKTDSPVRIDGAFNETHWTLDRQATRVGLGSPNNTLSFGTLWDAASLYLAIRVTDSQLVSTGTGQNRDSVEIFIDALNDKQAEFNLQHRQFSLALDGVLSERGGRVAGVESAILPVPGGYQIEMRIPWNHLGITAAVNTAIGIDLGNNDVDLGNLRQHYLAYDAVDATDPRPSQFANALLTATAVSGTGGEPAGPAGPPPLAYEPFDYNPGALHGLAGGSGWASAWEVQNSDVVLPGYAVSATTPLAPAQPGVTPGYLTGGRAYLSAGRLLNTSSAAGAPFTGFLTGSQIGGAGRTIWVSALLRKDVANDETLALNLHSGSIAWNSSNPQIALGYFGSASNVGGQRRFGLSFTGTNGSTAVVNSNLPLVTGQTSFLVSRIVFGGGATPTAVALWVNPPAAESPPATPALTVEASANFTFRAVMVRPGVSAGYGSADEIRIGASWQSVAPMTISPPAPVSYSPPPSIYQTSPLVTLSTPAPGAVIRYTTDGSVPLPTSAIYQSPLLLAATTTVRAVAILPGGTSSAISGGTFQILPTEPAFASWLAENQLPAETDPLTAPSGSPVSYLERFAFNLPPQSQPMQFSPGMGSGLPVAALSTPGNFSFNAIARRTGGLRYWIRHSGDLLVWDEINLSVLPDGVTTGPGYRLTKEPAAASGWFQIHFQIPSAEFGKRFLNVRVEMP